MLARFRGTARRTGKAPVPWVGSDRRVLPVIETPVWRPRFSAAQLHQQFGDLYRVERGALQELIAADEQFDSPAVIARYVLPDAAHETVVHSRGIDRHRVFFVGRIVHDLEARGF